MDIIYKKAMLGGVAVTKKTIGSWLIGYDPTQILKAISVVASKGDSIKAPTKYISALLLDMDKKKEANINVAGKENKLRFNNFEGRDHDFADIEDKLLDRDRIIDEEEEQEVYASDSPLAFLNKKAQ